MMTPQRIAAYGEGFFALAKEEGLQERILAEIRALLPLLNRRYLRLLTDPQLSERTRIGMVGELLDGRVHPYMANFVKLMTKRRLAYAIGACFREYERLYYETRGGVIVLAESAAELTCAQKQKLEEKLRFRIGQRIEIRYRVNPSLLGGMRIAYSNRELDHSVRARLDEMGAALAGRDT